MTIEMQETIKKETNRCPHDLAYLATGTSGNQPKCKVDYSNGKNVLILVASQGRVSCPYQIPFGNDLMCICPVNFYLNNTTATK